MPIESVLEIIAAITIVFGIFCVSILLLLSEIGLVVLFVAAFTSVIAVSSGVTLFAAAFLYPEAMVSDGWPELFWLVIPASLASVILFDFILDALMPRRLRIRIKSDLWFGLGEAVGRGLFVALMLIAASLLVPDAAGVSAGAALAAGAVSAFVRYYLGLSFDDTGDVDLVEDDFIEELD